MNAIFYTSPYTTISISCYNLGVLPEAEYSGVGSASGFEIYQFKEDPSVTLYDSGALNNIMGNLEIVYASSAMTYGIHRNADHDEGSGVLVPEFSTRPTSSNEVTAVGYTPTPSLYSAGDVFLAVAKISANDDPRLGFLIRGISADGYSTGYSFCYQTDAYDDMNKIFDMLDFSPEPGTQGFRPTGRKARKPAGGGVISGRKPVYPTDELEQPGAPDETVASVVRTGFLNIYQLNEANLVKLGKCLFDGLMSKLNNIFMSPLDSIVSLQIFPCTPSLGSSEAVKVLKYSCIAADLSEDCVANRLSAQFKTYDFGTLTIPEMWNSFLDYDATSFSLYLPFIGSVDIPVGEVMGGSINVVYTVDFLTGMCVANVFCVKNMELADGSIQVQKAQHSYMGNCSIQVPLAQESYGSIVGSLMQAASSGLTGGIGAGVASVVGSAASGGFKPTIETKGTINANAGFCSVLYPYITITRPITAEPEYYQEVMGYPSYVVDKLGDCQDLCICDNIDLSGLSGATDSEMDRIRQMCKDGVYV